MLPHSNEPEIQFIIIPPITLTWSAWYHWHHFLLDARSDPTGIRVPQAPGVYEARHAHTAERLTIGKAANLRMRIKQGLVKGKAPHSSGSNIRMLEDTADIVVRWAVTDRPSAVEEELHRQYREQFGRLPWYTERT